MPFLYFNVCEVGKYEYSDISHFDYKSKLIKNRYVQHKQVDVMFCSYNLLCL